MTANFHEQQRAERSAEAMLDRDAASAGLGITLEEVTPGRARMRMQVTESMLNGHRICHGAFLFALADTTFAVACNTANRVTVAASAHIDFLKPAYLGDVLHAEADMRHQGRRTGIYDIVVEDEKRHSVALFRGRSHRLDKPLYADDVDANDSDDLPGQERRSAGDPEDRQ